MKKYLVTLLLGIALGTGAMYVYAQATISLFPETQVSVELYTKAVEGVCYVQGYGRDADGEIDDAAWADSPAKRAFYRDYLIDHLRAKYRRAQWMIDRSELPNESEYDLGVITP